MSSVLLQEARALSKQLSVTQKAQLIEWLSSDLRQTLVEQDAAAHSTTGSPLNGGNHPQDEPTAHSADQTWEEGEPTWTAAEIRELMKPDPKTGAEIVALLKQLDLSSWQEQEIPDVVEWLHNQREQARQQREAQWGAVES